MQLMLGAVIDAARDVEPELWRRYLEIFLQGLRADPAPPQPLTTAALPTDRVPDVLSAGQPTRH